ncbi:MAG: hypothetical protein CMO61_07710 [Verrucomicrobiales bacterium]|nr:hypothetical protein [Verrucomicrobiales bacterium]|tara:strand:+ start:3665 stop:4111 length:447 start_codon:yes stop_codon:yes gene_type:complete
MSESRPSFLLVDGNNIIHAWPDLLKRHRTFPGSAHRVLIQALSDYRDWSEDRVVVVFDGLGETVDEERAGGGMQIFYTSGGLTADDVIERLAIKYAQTYHITVATDDRAEQDIVVGAGGEALSSAGLKEKIERANRDRDGWINQHRRR